MANYKEPYAVVALGTALFEIRSLEEASGLGDQGIQKAAKFLLGSNLRWIQSYFCFVF